MKNNFKQTKNKVMQELSKKHKIQQIKCFKTKIKFNIKNDKHERKKKNKQEINRFGFKKLHANNQNK